MKADRFYSVPYEGRNRADVQALRMACGGLVAYARWHVLLELLYSSEGVVDNSNELIHSLLLKELECDEKTFQKFVETCVDLGMLEAKSWARNKLVSHGVIEQLQYQKARSDAGKRSGEARRKKQVAEQVDEHAD